MESNSEPTIGGSRLLRHATKRGAHHLDNETSRRQRKDANAIYGVPLVAVLISGIALTGSIFLYCNSLQLQSELNSLREIVIGAKKEDSQQHNLTNPGLLDRFAQITSSLNRAILQLKLWANVSSCLLGSDLIIDRYCYRYLDYQLDWWKAEAFCQKRGGHLAYIEDTNTWNQTINFMNSRDLTTIWVGLYKKRASDKWWFPNGREANFTRWDSSNLFDDGDNCASIRYRSKR